MAAKTLPLAATLPSARVTQRLANRAQRVAVRASSNNKTIEDAVVKTTAFASLASTFLIAGNAQAAMEVADLAAGDARSGLLLLPVAAALGWVGFNITGPALNQLSAMSDRKGLIAGLGLGAAALLAAQNADAATEAMQIAAGDGRSGLLFLPLVAALGWVGFNIAGPALNQLNAMNSKKGLIAGLGLGAASLLAAQNADAATEAMQLAAGDGRSGLLFLPLVAALGWVGFNIAGPALNQLSAMNDKKKGLVAGLGLASLLAAQNADAATEAMQIAAGDGRSGLLFLPLVAALGWVGFNIAGPALNQLSAMNEKKK